jgi:hypothetical protein
LTQVKVYGVSLSLAELANLKALVEGRTGGGFDFGGFAGLQELLVRDLNTFTCWELLDAFRFDADLILHQEAYSFLDCPAAVEWAGVTAAFLQGLFKKYAVNDELSHAGLREIFSPVETPPWSPKDLAAWDQLSFYVQTTPSGGLTLEGWECLWHWILATDKPTAFKYLVYIGFRLPVNQSVANRTHVFTASVVGADGVGKKSLLEWFLHKPLEQHHGARTKVVCGVLDREHHSYLILRTDACSSPDIVILLYDSLPSSKDSIKASLRREDLQTPKLLVLNKTNPDDELTVYEFAIDLNLTDFAQVSLKQHRPDALFTQISAVLKKSSRTASVLRQEHRSV